MYTPFNQRKYVS